MHIYQHIILQIFLHTVNSTEYCHILHIMHIIDIFFCILFYISNCILCILYILYIVHIDSIYLHIACVCPWLCPWLGPRAIHIMHMF
jgi:hypothetical protein